MEKATPGLRPELTVAAIAEQDGRFLVVEEHVHGQLVINQPAGHVEAGESILDAVRREALEETAWHFEPEAIVGIYYWQRDPASSPFLRVAFAGRCHSHERHRSLDTGIVRTLWLSREDLLARSPRLRSPMVLRGVDDYLAGRRWPLDLVQDLGLAELDRIAIHAARL
jgi:8-oxo-dGTP pyrophosphatase MutT (NUDIX family)